MIYSAAGDGSLPEKKTGLKKSVQEPAEGLMDKRDGRKTVSVIFRHLERLNT